MWFRNLLPYRLNTTWALSPGALEELLRTRPLTPCTGLVAQSQGWVSPRGNGQLVASQGRQMLLAYGVETKLLPASVVKDAMLAKCAQIEARMGFKPGKKQQREIKDQVTAELLPQAFAKRRSTRAWIDPAGGWLIVDTASAKRGEELTTLLRETLGELAIEPLSTTQSPLSAMTAWLATGRVPGGFGLDQDCEMKTGGDDPGAVRFAKHGLEGEDVRRHVKDGKSVTQLGLTWLDRMRLVLAEPGVIKRLRFELIEQDRAENEPQGTSDERFDADFTLMCGELAKLLDDLVKSLGGLAKP